MRWSFEVHDPRWIARLFLLLGFAFLAVSAGIGHRTYGFLQTALVADGTVVALEQRRSGTYAPAFEFADAHGVRHRVYSETGSNPPAYEVGERVRVLYPAADPRSARLEGFLELWLGPLVFLILGLPFVAMGWFVHRRLRV